MGVVLVLTGQKWFRLRVGDRVITVTAEHPHLNEREAPGHEVFYFAGAAGPRRGSEVTDWTAVAA